MAPQGWAELMAWMQARSAAGQLDPEAVWDQFRALATTSEHPGLPELVVRFRAAPSKDRLALVGTIASMLAPVEWPATWENARRRLVSALDELCRELRDDPGSLARVLDLSVGGDIDLFASGRAQVRMARDLLRTPCRRDELRIAAELCEMGTFWCWGALVRALRRPERRAATEVVVAARHRYAIAYEVYVESARAMNDACGAVLIGIPDLRLPSEKAD